MCSVAAIRYYIADHARIQWAELISCNLWKFDDDWQFRVRKMRPLLLAVAGPREIGRVRNIVRNPTSANTKLRYSGPMKLYYIELRNAGLDLEKIEPSCRRPDSANPVYIAMALIYQRCGLPSERYEGLSAHSTGGAIRSGMVSYWRSHGHNGEFVDLENGAFRGNPRTSEEIKVLLQSLIRGQKSPLHSSVRFDLQKASPVVCRALSALLPSDRSNRASDTRAVRVHVPWGYNLWNILPQIHEFVSKQSPVYNWIVSIQRFTRPAMASLNRTKCRIQCNASFGKFEEYWNSQIFIFVKYNGKNFTGAAINFWSKNVNIRLQIHFWTTIFISTSTILTAINL